MLLVNTASVRTVIGFWWVYCVIIGATYSGNLIAFLAVDKYSPPFETLEDIVAQNEYSFGTLGESVWEIIFQVRSYQKISRHVLHTWIRKRNTFLLINRVYY